MSTRTARTAWTGSLMEGSGQVELENGTVKVIHTLTSMGCPVGPMIQQQIDEVVRALPGVDDVEVELTWDPPWTPEKMSEDAKFILGFG